MNGAEITEEALGNSFVSELLRSDGDMINYSVMRIASSLELLENSLGSVTPPRALRYFDAIRAMCRNLQRSSAMKYAVTSVEEDSEPLRIDRLAEDLAAGCVSVLGERLKLTTSAETGAIVKADPVMIRFVYLTAFRKAAENCRKKFLQAEISASDDGETASLKLTVDSSFADEKDFGAYGVNPFFEKNFAEAIDAIAAKTGAEAFVTDNELRLAFKKTDPKSGMAAKSPFAYFDPGNYSFYRFMLSDIE